MTTHFRVIEKELTSGNHISSHLYQISSEKKYIIVSRQNSKYVEWEEYLHETFPFDLSGYTLRALTPPSCGGVKDPWLSLVYNKWQSYNPEHLKLFGINNKNNFSIDFGICKKVYDVGKKSISRCCFSYKSFLETNHFMMPYLNKFVQTITKYQCGLNEPSAVCFSLDEDGDILDDTIHVQYPCENKIILNNLASKDSSLKKFLICECGAIEKKIEQYNFLEYKKHYREGKFYYIKIALSENNNPIVKFYRHTEY